MGSGLDLIIHSKGFSAATILGFTNICHIRVGEWGWQTATGNLWDRELERTLGAESRLWLHSWTKNLGLRLALVLSQMDGISNWA